MGITQFLESRPELRDQISSLQESFSKSSDKSSFAHFVLKQKLFLEEDYLGWAQKHYLIPGLKTEYFQMHQADPKLWKIWKDLYKWSPICIPIAEWDGVLYIGCIEKPDDFNHEIPVCFLLCPHSYLEEWHKIYLASTQAPQKPKETSPDDLFSPETFSPEALRFDELSEVQQKPKAEEKPLDPNAPIELQDVSETPETLEAEEAERSEEGDDPLEGLEEFLSTTDDAVFENTVGPPRLEKLSAQQIVSDKTQSPRSSTHASAAASKEVDSVSKLIAMAPEPPTTTKSTPLEHPNKSTSPTTPSLEKTHTVNLTKMTPPISGKTTPPISNQTMPPVSSKTTPPVSGKTVPPVSGNTMAPGTNANRPNPAVSNVQPMKAQPKTSIPVTAGAKVHFPIMDIMAHQPQLLEQFRVICEPMKTNFEKYMFFMVEENESEIRPVFWSDEFVGGDQNYSLTLKKPSIFYIVTATFKPFHGYVTPNEINEKFFDDWNQGLVPDHATLVPVIHKDRLMGILMGIGASSAYTPQVLRFVEKIAQELTRKLGGNETQNAA